MQLAKAIQSNWKTYTFKMFNLKHSNIYLQNLIPLDHQLVKFNSFFDIEKPELRELYCITNFLHNIKTKS